ncbi:MAG: hypothetical protein AUK55_10335 [Syntrophobacteraceae bacterium CG2_30_61_12]|nr:MAG: hypothetical protein AUK55_10335 [Syntrophobacteraceae bacterium CG2_30_61_12]
MIVTAATGIMVAKPVNDLVPNWREFRDEKGFAEGYPNIIDNKISTMEIPCFQIMRKAYAFGVFLESSEKSLARIGVQTEITFPSTGRDCLADIDGYLARRSIRPGRDDCIRFKLTRVVDCVNAGSRESLDFAKRCLLSCKESIRHAFS